jgi:1,4-dihydroxy-2-naphthoyl-CoA hydrolase
VVGTMPVEGNTQPLGLLNGGASMALAETLGSIGAHLHAGDGATAVGIEISGSHHRSARRGLVTGVATPVSLGRTVAVYEIVIRDEGGERLCTARLSCLIRRAAAAG